MLVLTRSEVLDVRQLVTVAEITTSVRDIAAEVDFDHATVGLKDPSVIMTRVCSAITYALGC
ncbi:MAG: hypothetical protein ABR540_15935 [Acidimicrobiales bacterium]